MFIKSMANRQVFSTYCDRIGIENVELREGDIICVLFGASMPLALRTQEDGRLAIVNEICKL